MIFLVFFFSSESTSLYACGDTVSCTNSLSKLSPAMANWCLFYVRLRVKVGG